MNKMNDINTFSQIEIIDVVDYERSKIDYCTQKRKFNVLSIRLSGEAIFTHNNRTIKTNEKIAIIVPKNIEYRQETEGERVISIHFKGDSPFNKITTFTVYNHIRNLFCDIVKLWQARDTYGFYMAHSKLYYILSTINNTNSEDTFKDKIATAYEEINMRFKDPELKINDIAQQNNMSGVYLRREFKKRYNISPKKMLISLRLNNAALLLENNYCSVTEAAIQSGFSDPNYFSTVFKNNFGVPPIEYLK